MAGEFTLLEPKEFTLTGQDGKEHTYIISKFPAVQGREIVSKYPLTALPKVGDYGVNEETMLKLMSYVAVETKKGVQQRLTTLDLVNNHVRSWEDLAKIEMEMMQYNCSFFLRDKALTFLDVLIQKVGEKVFEMLTPSLHPSYRQEKPVTQN